MSKKTVYTFDYSESRHRSLWFSSGTVRLWLCDTGFFDHFGELSPDDLGAARLHISVARPRGRLDSYYILNRHRWTGNSTLEDEWVVETDTIFDYHVDQILNSIADDADKLYLWVTVPA